MSVFDNWLWRILMMLGAAFFLLFGIHLLVAAFALNHPLWFIMTFFSSNLIILISAAILFGLLYRTFCSPRPAHEERAGTQDREGSDEEGSAG